MALIIVPYQGEVLTLKSMLATLPLYIKTYPGGSGYVTNVTFENIRSKASLYGLDVTQYWQSTFTPDTGAVKLSNLVFK
jgi:hypothetical protein